MELDIKIILALVSVAVSSLIALTTGWVIMQTRVKSLTEKVDKFEENKGKGLKEMEGRLTKHLDELHEHFDHEVEKLRGNIATLFGKTDRINDTFGDTRVVLTAMAGKLGNPGNDKVMIEMIQDIGRKRNGR